MNENEKKLKIIIDDCVNDIWPGNKLESLEFQELVTLRLNMIVRKHHTKSREEKAIYDELIGFLDKRKWMGKDGKQLSPLKVREKNSKTITKGKSVKG